MAQSVNNFMRFTEKVSGHVDVSDCFGVFIGERKPMRYVSGISPQGTMRSFLPILCYSPSLILSRSYSKCGWSYLKKEEMVNSDMTRLI